MIGKDGKYKDWMTFAEAMEFVKGRAPENMDIMEERKNKGRFHVIREFGIAHWSKHYKTVTRVRVKTVISGRRK